MAAPPVVQNGTPPTGPSDRKPSVTIGTNRSTAFPNGSPMSATSTRAQQINFGQFNDANAHAHADGPRPAAAHADPRVNAPAKSPSPIPPPAASGGRPPSGFQPQNGPNFGSIGNDNANAPPVAAPNGPSIQAGSGAGSNAQSPVHLRRQSSQQSDVSNQGNFTPGNRPYNRNDRRNFSAGFPQQLPYSPGPNYRQLPGQQRPGQPFNPQFPGQPNMQFAGNAHAPQRSPSFQPGSQPGTPHLQHQQMAYGYNMGQPYNFAQLPNQGQAFGNQPHYDAQYNFYPGSYQMHPGYLGQQGPPPSPGPAYRQAPPSAQQQFRQGQFNSGPQASQPMSRTASHASTDRPASSLGNAQNLPPVSHTPLSIRSHTPSQASAGGPPPPGRPASSAFTVPPKTKSKGIVIKDPSGNILNFEKAAPAAPPAEVAKAASPAPPSVAAVSASGATPTPTPPPASATPLGNKAAAAAASSKTAEEIRAQFKESVGKTQGADKPKEETGAADKAQADKAGADADAEAAAKAADDKASADAAAAAEKEKATAEKATAEKAAAEKAAAEKAAAEKAAAEKAAADKAAADKAAADKAAADKAASDKAASDKAAADKAASDKDASDKAAAEKSAADAANSIPAEPKPAEEDDEMARLIAEMEAAEKAEEEREKAYADKRKAQKEAEAAKALLSADEAMKLAEREAEAIEAQREQERKEQEEGDDPDKLKAFAELKKPALGPGAEAESPVSEDLPTPPEEQPAAKETPKSKPSPLKLDTPKSTEPPQPSAAMKSLKSARKIQCETVTYPDGIQAPQGEATRRSGRVYDSVFLMQFQDVFKEKPSIDWEQRLRETIGDPSDPGASAGPRSAKTPASSRPGGSQRGAPPTAFQPMGSLGSGRPLPSKSTSEQRFAMSNQPAASFGGARAGAFPMGTMPVPNRQPSMGGMSHQATRQGTSRRQDSKRMSAKDQDKANRSMPLTASGDVKALEPSKSGWKPMSLGQGAGMAGPDPSGHLAPDMVQRKVKAALNKMTPERFDKISDQILEIAHQSKDETDGRTLRQVIQLTFEKACDEAHWASMYAKFCFRVLETMSNEIKDETILDKQGQPVAGGGLFRKYLLNRCQEEFERGWEVNLPDKKEAGESEEAVMLSDEYYIAMAAKRRGLGLIQFIGELFKLRMLSMKIMHQCFLRLLDFTGMPEDSTIESIVKLMRTVGATMDADGPQGPTAMRQYFDRIDNVVKMPGLPSRVRFMLFDIIDLRRANWQSKNEIKGPKTIQEIREEAAAAQAAEAARAAASRQQGGRGPPGGGRQASYNQMPPPDYQRNTLGTDELRKLNARTTSRQASAAARPLGPSSMFSRGGSGRQGLGPGGPGMSSFGKSSPGSATPTSDSRSQSKRDDATPATPGGSSNAFSALEGLQGEEVDLTQSPPAAKAEPAAAPAAADAAGDKPAA